MTDLSVARGFGAQDWRPGHERLEEAMTAFAKDFSRTAAIAMESCLHCGHCAEACHFYVATREPKYTPIWKLEPFRQAWKREAGPFRTIYRALGLKRAVTAGQLQEWQELLYDACTMCGRCTAACPMGIDIASLVGLARHAMFRAGLVPEDLYAAAARAERDGSPLGATPKVLAERLAWLADEHGVVMPVDLPRAEVLATFSSVEIMKYPRSLVAIARVLGQAGLPWTISTRGYETTNFGMLAGSLEWQRATTRKIVEAAEACGATTVLLPECGHAYTALRWQGAEVMGRRLPFRVLHVSELLDELIAAGRLRVKRVGGTATFHDPCQLTRRGGAGAAPRRVLDALGIERREAAEAGELDYCCGGGGGVIANSRADGLRRRAFAIKIAQMEAAGGERLVTSCANCRLAFEDGAAHHHWPRPMGSLLELVAENLA